MLTGRTEDDCAALAARDALISVMDGCKAVRGDQRTLSENEQR